MTKNKSAFQKTGIILSYLYMLVACYFFNWKPFGIFISYLIEVIVLITFYCISRVLDENRNPAHYRNSQPLMNIIIGTIPLIIFQYFIIGWMSGIISDEQNFLTKNLLLSKETIYSFTTILIIYSIQAVRIKNHKERLKFYQDNFFFKVIALSTTNILGSTLVLGFGIRSLLLVLSGMVIIRIIQEFYVDSRSKLT